MTISSENRKAGPFSGNGVTTAFPFAFKVFAATEVYVVQADEDGVESVLELTSDYTVALNPNQNTNPGGTVTLLAALPTDYTMVVTSDIEFLQPTDLTNQGGFYPNVINNSLDRLTILVQQVREDVSRSAKLPITNPADADSLVADIVLLANNQANIDAVAGSIGAVEEVADDLTNVNTVAGSITNVNSVAGSISNVNTVAGSIDDVSTVAENIVDIQNAEENANAAISAANAAALSESNAASSAAAAATALDNFDDRYLGAKASDPTVDNDGDPLVSGALYYRSTAPIGMKVYDGAQWIEASAAQQASLVTFEFVATSGQTSFTGNDVNGVPLSYTPGGIIVSLNGLVLRPGDDYTATTGTSIVLATGATAGHALCVHAFATLLIANTYTKPEVDAALAVQLARGLFRKANPDAAAWTKTGAGTATTASTIYAEVNGVIRTIASGTTITMPTLANGTDYAIWLTPAGALQATNNHTAPPVANSRKVGGFHYAPGGNATAQSGGNTTPQINEFSFWDLNWKPNCADPRGMTLVAGGFWSDIYLTGVDAITNGTSKFNVTMADGSSPPKVPTMFGGNGSTTYGSYTWFEAMELGTAFGKRCPTQQEFMALAYGTTEASSVGTDQVSTVLNSIYTSRWGVIQATGVLWVWGRDRGGPFAGASWNANTEGRGSEYNAPNSALFGGTWDNGANSGSRCSAWNNAASPSLNLIGSRFVCDHLKLD